MCPKWCIWGCAGPLVSCKMTVPLAREHRFHISACRTKVTQNGSKWPSCKALWPPKYLKILERTLKRNHTNLMRFLMLPGLQNDPEMGSKWRRVIFCFRCFFECLHGHCVWMAPERPRYAFFLKMVSTWTAFLPRWLSFSTVFLCGFVRSRVGYDPKSKQNREQTEPIK